MLIQTVSIGEESGALDSMLDKAATCYEEMVDNTVDGLPVSWNPSLCLSSLSLLVIALCLPIFSMGDAISGG